MRTVLLHPTYRRLFLAQVVALTGTGLATVALGLLAYDLAGARAGLVLGTVFAVKMVAYVVVAPLASALFAGVPQRTVMVGADVVRLLAALALPLVGSVWQVYVLVFVLQAASATFTPTFQSALPQVLPDEEDYTSALSLSRLAYDLEAILSPLLAGLALLLISSSTLFLGTAAGFLASALLVVSVSLPPRTTPAEEPGHATPVRGRTLLGLSLFLRSEPLRAVMALNLAVAAVGAFVLVQTVVIVRDTFGLPQAVVPLALASVGAGSTVIALGLPRLLRTRTERQVMLVSAAVLVAGMVTVPLALRLAGTAGLVVLCLLWAVVGAGWSGVETPVGRLIRRQVAAEELPAAFAAQFSLSHACWLVTYPLAGWLGSMDLTLSACSMAATALVASLVAARTWTRDGRPPTKTPPTDARPRAGRLSPQPPPQPAGRAAPGRPRA